jgi:hypothetical protein
MSLYLTTLDTSSNDLSIGANSKIVLSFATLTIPALYASLFAEAIVSKLVLAWSTTSVKLTSPLKFLRNVSLLPVKPAFAACLIASAPV